MKPSDRLTILRNRSRARDLRAFRARVLAYFELLEYGMDGLAADREAVQAARAWINRLLPRIVQVVAAADLGRGAPGGGRHPAGRAVEILQNVFDPRYAEGAYQEVLDVIDMAIGVYDASQASAWLRTVNPFHYILTALGFVAGVPRRALVAIGLVRVPGARPEDLGRLESALRRLGATEELLEARFAEIRESQSRMYAGNAEMLNDIAERMDFVERVLAQQRPAPRLQPGESKAATPV